MLKARDAVRAAFDQDKFRGIVAKAKQAQTDVIEMPTAAIDNVIAACSINEEHKEALLTYFLKDYDMTRFGLSQAVSRVAQDVEDPDDAGDLEAIAGKIIQNPALVLG
jgi:hypothetical protein